MKEAKDGGPGSGRKPEGAALTPLRPEEPDLVFHKGKQFKKTEEMIPHNQKQARKYSESGGNYITRESHSGEVHDESLSSAAPGDSGWPGRVIG